MVQKIIDIIFISKTHFSQNITSVNCFEKSSIGRREKREHIKGTEREGRAYRRRGGAAGLGKRRRRSYE